MKRSIIDKTWNAEQKAAHRLKLYEDKKRLAKERREVNKEAIKHDNMVQRTKRLNKLQLDEIARMRGK